MRMAETIKSAVLQLQKEEPKTYTPLEAANEYHKEKGVLPPNDEHSWYVIAVNDYLKRTQTYTQEEMDEAIKNEGIRISTLNKYQQIGFLD